jgi:phage shock protein C
MAKKLYRSQKKKMIAGVCGGLADYFDIDVSLLRLLFVAFTLLTAVLPFVFFYLIAWIIVPVQTEISPGEKKEA